MLSGQGRIEDFELQRLLSANRWVIDIPADREGWYLDLETKTEGEIKRSGGCNVHGGERLVLLVRRDLETKKIYYSWYQNSDAGQSSCGGVIDDPLGSNPYGTHGEGLVQLGEPIYYANRKGESLGSNSKDYDYEVRVVLHEPPVK